MPSRLWKDISMDFILGLTKTQRDNCSIFVVVDKFYKISCLIYCKKTLDIVHLDDLLFKEVVKLHELPRSTISSRDRKFSGYFLEDTLEKDEY